MLAQVEGETRLENKSYGALLNVEYGAKFHRKPRVLLGLRRKRTTECVQRIQALFQQFLSSCVSHIIEKKKKRK